MDTPTVKRQSLGWLSGVLLVLGILGFIPGITHNYHLFWLAQVGPWFNTIYIVMAAIGFLALAGSESVASGVAKVYAVIFAVWAIIGLFVGSGQVLGFIENNYWSVVLNAIMAVAAASIGWAGATATAPGRSSMAFGEYQRDRHDRR